jgi:CheY-like chemotaxis protein
MVFPAPERRAPILVVDPDDDTRALYRASFQFGQCEVVEASDGREALIEALMRTPALVITELTLPFIDGYSLCALLRRDRATADVPILVVTAEAHPAAGDRARLAGADNVLVKPATPERVVEEMRRLLALSDDPPRGTVSAPMPAESAATTEQSVEGTRPRGHRRPTLTKAHKRFTTTTPAAAPPTLSCPWCDRPLIYQRSHIGGVSVRQSEQWDDYACAQCGGFQYRQRTRTLHHVVH